MRNERIVLGVGAAVGLLLATTEPAFAALACADSITVSTKLSEDLSCPDSGRRTMASAIAQRA